jgi:small-conductance mechanosensitive channel/CRP-like cAMP-binding protein
MTSDLLGRLSALTAASQGVTIKLVTLSAVLLFFLLVHSLRSLLRWDLSPSKVTGTIRLALLGLGLLLLETQLRDVALYGGLVANVASLVVMLCLANGVAYVVVDVYCWFRMGRQVPSFVRDILTLLVYVAFALTSLRVIFHIDVASILTTTTVLTAAVAFAMQATLANAISGFYVQNDENLRRGTWIALKDQDLAGQVVNVGFRYVTLRTLDNQRVMVPNSHVVQNVVLNLGSRAEGVRTAVHLKVGLGYEMPPEKAIALMGRILLQEEHVEREPAPIVLVHAFLDSAVEYDLKYFLDDYASHAVTRGRVLSRIWYAVLREGYSFPFPHREVISKAPQEPFRVEPSELASTLQRTEILRSLSLQELQRLSAVVHRRVFGPGEVIVQQGDAGDSLFVVRGGRLRVRIDGAEVGVLGDGDIFGEMSLLTGEKRKATVVAASEVHLVEVSKEHLEPVLRANPALLDMLSAVLARREESNVEAKRRAEASHAEEGGKEAFLRKLRAFFGIPAGRGAE